MAEKIIRSFKYRIYPSKRQAETLNAQLAICCELYNAALQERRDAWKLERKCISYYSQCAQLREIKIEREDAKGIYSQILQDVLRRTDKAYKCFFLRVNRGEKAGYPRFKSLARYASLTYTQHGFTADARHLQLSKIGRIRIKLHQPIDGAPKTLTIKREAGRWFAVFACEVTPRPLPFSDKTIGVDVGLTSFAVLSDGVTIENPRHYRHGHRALRVAQRRVARRKKGSNRRRKAVVLLQRAHEHIRQQRADFHHKLSRKIVNENGLIAVEDLNTKGLASGMLAKSVNDAGWAQFLNMIAYKAESAGRVFVRVNPAGTSQTCTCGAEVRKALKDRWHLCLNCGLSANRDHVSAQVILGRGLRLQALTSPVVECVA